jgi:hypothetical protein
MSSEEDSRDNPWDNSSSSSEPDDDFMLKLYTGKLNQDKQYTVNGATTEEDEVEGPPVYVSNTLVCTVLEIYSTLRTTKRAR